MAKLLAVFRPGLGGGGPEICIFSPQEAIWHRRSLCRLGGGGGEQGVEEEGPKNRPTATPGDSGTFGSGRV